MKLDEPTGILNNADDTQLAILHIHNEITNKGGAEVYLENVQVLLRDHSYSSYMLGIQESGKRLKWAFQDEEWKQISESALKERLASWIHENHIDLICI